MPKTWLQQKDQQVQKKIKVWKFTPTHILTHCLWLCNFLKIDLLVPTELFHHVVNDALNFIVFWQNSQCWKIFQVFWLIKQWILANEQTQVWQISFERRMPSNHSVDQKGSWLLFLGSQVMRGSFTQWAFNQCQNLPISSEIGQNLNEIYVNLCPKICQRCHEHIRRRLWSGMLSTVWKILYFSITYILREINFGDSRSEKCAIFITFRHSEFWLLMIFYTFWRLEFTKLTKFSAPKNAKNGSFKTSRCSLRLISR